VLTAWAKEDKRLKKEGVAKKDRPVQPERDSLYPTKAQLGLRLLQEFKDANSHNKCNAFKKVRWYSFRLPKQKTKEVSNENIQPSNPRRKIPYLHRA
jgi:hypothetical protein